MNKASLYNIKELGLNQIYLSSKKVENVRQWFSLDMLSFQPIEIYHFGDKFRITDGHSRAYVAWENGIEKIPAIISDSEIVTGELGQIQYKHDGIWCERFGLKDISFLHNRILAHDKYVELWMGRCDKMYDLVCAIHNNILDKDLHEAHLIEFENKGLYIYGISEDLSLYYCEDINGNLKTEPRPK